MSLKEWKNDEINTKLMKKWGFLKEGKFPAGDAGHGDSEDEHDQFDKKEREAELEEGSDYRDEDELEEGNAGDFAAMADEEDPSDLPPGNLALDRQAMAKASKGAKVSGKKLGRLGAAGGRRQRPGSPGGKNVFTTATEGQSSGKISVKEAKQITRRIIERIRKEAK